MKNIVDTIRFFFMSFKLRNKKTKFLVDLVSFAILVDEKKKKAEEHEAIEIIKGYVDLDEKSTIWFINEVDEVVEELKEDIEKKEKLEEQILQIFSTTENEELKKEVYEIFERIFNADKTLSKEEISFMNKIEREYYGE